MGLEATGDCGRGGEFGTVEGGGWGGEGWREDDPGGLFNKPTKIVLETKYHC